ENTELMVFIRPTIIRVHGTDPAQMRIREVERLREDFYLEPIINPEKQDEARVKKAAAVTKRKGNKFVR
ncbi:MAG TPA: hypothetical protein PKW68_05785, partial [bacterium]|nr:hypothetical protein [bacterium]